MAGKREVLKVMRAAVGLREHVVHLERKVEDDLGGVAVFTAVPSAARATAGYSGFTARPDERAGPCERPWP
jgi:hypothetical protein